MLQHAGIEVSPVDLDRMVEFFAILGFTVVPDPFDGGFTWLERDGTQIHLMHEDFPTVPARAHVAVVTPNFDAALARLQEHGFAVERDSPARHDMTQDAEEMIIELLRDLARWLYRQLGREYEYLTSDEIVDEAITANDYTFTESGRQFG